MPKRIGKNKGSIVTKSGGESPRHDLPVPPASYSGLGLSFHRFAAPIRPISASCSGVRLRARAAPPFLPPSRPIATAWGFFLTGLGAGNSSERPVARWTAWKAATAGSEAGRVLAVRLGTEGVYYRMPKLAKLLRDFGKGATLLYVLTGCASAEKRCVDISTAAGQSPALEQWERQLEDSLHTAIRDFDSLPPARQQFLLRSARATSYRATLGAYAGSPSASDSAPHIVAPSRPSDLAWSSEHCYNGHAR